MKSSFLLLILLFTFINANQNSLTDILISDQQGRCRGKYLLPPHVENIEIKVNGKEFNRQICRNSNKVITGYIDGKRYSERANNSFSKILSLGIFKILDLEFNTLEKENSIEIIFSKENNLRVELADLKENYTRVKGLIKNKSMLNEYTSISTFDQRSKPGFIILATNAIVDSVENLNAYIAMKEEMGYEVNLFTEEQWGGGVGDSAADNIRSWLIENYNKINMKYVLFIGYPHPEKGGVPMKMTWPRFSEADYREAPTDLYFADLTGNWDLDNDGNFGEFEDDFMQDGGPDHYAELNIGRIPVYSKTKVEHILSKLIRYEEETKESAKSWRYNVLLPMNNMNDVADSNFTPGIRLAEAIKADILEPNNFESFRIYDDNYDGFEIDGQAELTPCSYATVKNTWNSQDFGVVLWQAHGFAQHATDVMSIPYSKVLNDERVPFVMSTSCHNGRPETDNLSMYLLQNGAINVISASRVEFWAPGQDNYWDQWPTGQSICYGYAKNLINDSLSSSEALNKLKSDIDVSMLELSSMWWMNWLVYNVYGDPSHGLYTWEYSLDNKTDIKKIEKLDQTGKIGVENSIVNLKDDLIIKWTDNRINKVEIKLYNSLGDNVLRRDISKGDFIYKINAEEIGPGSFYLLYNIQYNNGEKSKFMQIIGIRR